MAYDAAPSRRIPIDIDGSAVKYYERSGDNTPESEGTAPPGGFTTATEDERAKISDADYTTSIKTTTKNNYTGGADVWVYVVFAEAMDIDGVFMQQGTSLGTTTTWGQTSTDTTNGEDGAWSSYSMTNLVLTSDADAWREEIDDVSLSAVTGFRFYMHCSGANAIASFSDIHFYGTPHSGGYSRLEIVDGDNSDATFTVPSDQGDVPRGQVTTQTVKVKNNHATEQANTVSLDVEALLNSADDWVTFSTDGGDTYGTGPVSLGNIAAGGKSSSVTVKQVIPTDADIGPFDARLVTEATSWT